MKKKRQGKRKPLWRNHEKMVIAGASVEYMTMRLPINQGIHKKMTSEQLQKRKEEKTRFNAMLEVPDPKRTAPSVSRARAKLRRIILANAWRYYDQFGNPIPAKFFTVTFAENITDLKTANERIKKLIKDLNKRFENVLLEPLKYVYAIEFQERGAVHYHFVLLNFPFMDKVFSKIRDLWPDRFELKTISKTTDIERVIRYITKYLSKQTTDGRFWSQKRYSVSHGLKKIIPLTDPIAIRGILPLIEPFKKDSRIIPTDYIGDIDFTSYYLGDGGSLNRRMLDKYTREALELAEKGEKRQILFSPPPEKKKTKKSKPNNLPLL